MKFKCYVRSVKIAVIVATLQPLVPLMGVAANAAEIRTSENVSIKEIRPEVGGINAAVVSEHPLASQIGYDVLKAGGNATDAAVAMAASLAVVRPHMNSVGGDTFALFYDAKSGEITALNSSGKAAELATTYGSIAAADAYVEHRDLVDGPEVARVDSRVVDRILGGKKMTAYELLVLQRARAALIAELRAGFDGVMFAMPTVPHVAPAIAPLEADKELFHRVNLKTLRNTMMGNFMNLPGLAMPNGFDGGGMPTSFLLSGLAGQDDLVLGYGTSVQAAFDERLSA